MARDSVTNNTETVFRITKPVYDELATLKLELGDAKLKLAMYRHVKALQETTKP